MYSNGISIFNRTHIFNPGPFSIAMSVYREVYMYKLYNVYNLGCGFKHLLCSPPPGKWSNLTWAYFSNHGWRGENHHLAKRGKSWGLEIPKDFSVALGSPQHHGSVFWGFYFVTPKMRRNWWYYQVDMKWIWHIIDLMYILYIFLMERDRSEIAHSLIIMNCFLCIHQTSSFWNDIIPLFPFDPCVLVIQQQLTNLYCDGGRIMPQSVVWNSQQLSTT